MNEIRMILAEILLGWCIWIAPKNDDGARLLKIIRYYFAVVDKDLAEDDA